MWERAKVVVPVQRWGHWWAVDGRSTKMGGRAQLWAYLGGHEVPVGLAVLWALQHSLGREDTR